MKKASLIFIFSIFLGSMIFGEICHTQQGTDYGENGVVAYVESNHGPDGALFLDPYFKPDIENIDHKKILDAGCGGAPWSIYAAKNGGDVCAIDIQEGMIESAKKAIQSAQLVDKISIVKGDVAALPFEANFFDKAISICVGCNLPPESFEKHFIECHRTLKNDGVLVIGAPTSLDIVFTNGSKSQDEVHAHIQNVLSQLPDYPNPELISERLIQLEEVLSATFQIKNHRLELVSQEKDLMEGESIWRKLPKLVVPNRYYSKARYIAFFKQYHFEIEKIDLPHFKNEDEWNAYNKDAPSSLRLGKEYVNHPPFVIFHVKKSN